MTSSTELRNARILALNQEGKSNEEIQAVIAQEFPRQAITARSVAATIAVMGGTARSAPADSKVGLTVADILRQSADFITQRRELPPVPDQIRAVRLEEMGFDTEQEAVALFSDLHYYSKIDRRASGGMAEYNIDIARLRLIMWRDLVLRFTQIAQLTMPLKRMNIVALGDDLEGHGEMFQSQALQMSESIIFQVMGFVEDMVDIILSFLERYDTLNIIKVPGNHGRTAARAKGAYTPDNFETLAWELIAERVRGKTGGTWTEDLDGVRHLTGGKVDFHIVRSVTAKFDVLGWTCVARHGHGIKGLQATYTGAIDNKLRLNSIYGEVINFYFKAHLHEFQMAEHEIDGAIIQNGCFVGPSLLSVEMSRAAASLPSQTWMLFHPKHGLTQTSILRLAKSAEIRQTLTIGRVTSTE